MPSNDPYRLLSAIMSTAIVALFHALIGQQAPQKTYVDPLPGPALRVKRPQYILRLMKPFLDHAGTSSTHLLYKAACSDAHLILLSPFPTFKPRAQHCYTTTQVALFLHQKPLTACPLVFMSHMLPPTWFMT